MHINFLGQIVPFIYVLMSNRKESTYCAVFQYINENIFVLEFKLMMSDYERAMRNGFNTVVPSTKQYGCLFHYMSALKRFVIKNPRLLKLVLKDSNAHKFYRKLMCLPLLPAESIGPVFETVAAQARAFNNAFVPLLNYVKRQWLTRVSFLLHMILTK